MADNPSFEIPPQLREMAEKNVEQARAAYGQFMDFLTQAMNTWAKSPAGGGTPGLKAVQDRAVGFAKENAERSFGLASELARAKDVQEVLTLTGGADAGQVRIHVQRRIFDLRQRRYRQEIESQRPRHC